MTVFQNRLFARMGSPVTGQPQGATAAVQPGYLVCLDLAAEGRLLWKVEPEEGWAFEGSPVADDRGVYVAMRRHDIRPQAFVACFDADTGRLRWRRFVCGAETPARGVFYESTHNLLTLAGGTLYYNTNLGAVAAVARRRRPAVVGQPVSARAARRPGQACAALAARSEPLRFRSRHAAGRPGRQPPHLRLRCRHRAGALANRQRGGRRRRTCWARRGEWLIAGGRRLYWISLKEEDRGRVKHVWPDGAERPGYGRGVLAGESVLWPTRDKLYIFDQQTAQPRKVVDLAARGASGGNLLVADGRLLIATENELIAIGHAGTTANRDRQSSIART